MSQQNGSATADGRRAKFEEMAAEAGIDPDEFDGGDYELPEIVSAASLIADPPPAPVVLIEGLLHQGEKLVLGGSSKTNKTWSCLEAAISVASGKSWWGHPTTQAKVLYINFEIQPYHLARRLERVRRATGLDKVPDGLDVWNLRGYACPAQNLVREAIERMRETDYGLVVIDPIYKCLGDRNENDAGDIASLCNTFERLAVQTGAAVMFAAHFSKGNQASKSPIDRIGGSGVWARDADTILTVTPHEDVNVYVVEATVRNFPPVLSFGVRWDYPLMVRDEGVDPTRLRKPGRGAMYDDRHLLDSLLPEGMTYGAWRDAVIEKTGMSESSFKNKKRDLERMKKIEKVGNLYKRAVDWDAPPPA